jgi:dihydroflavonol-4-reductase
MSRTILVTGATGYIAKHIVLKLLERGDSVVGSVRNLSRDAELRDAMRAHLSDPALADNLRTVALNLEADDGWAEAATGVDAIIHTASPFPLQQPKDEDDLIRPAVDGALRALRAAKAAGVTRVVMTSSTVAVSMGNTPSNGTSYTEADWSRTEGDDLSAYGKSKTLAERSAWDYVNGEGAGIDLTCINPVFVMGAPVDGNYGTSIRVIERILAAQDPMIPRIGFPTVDVKDVAEAHIRPLDRPDTIGKRIIASDRFLWFRDMAEVIKAALPGRKIVTREAPNFVIKLLSLFDGEIKSIVPQLGKRDDVSNERAIALLGIDFRDARESVRDAALWVAENEKN